MKQPTIRPFRSTPIWCVAAVLLLLAFLASTPQHARAQGGAASTWGFNADGQLGNGKTDLDPSPAFVTGYSHNSTSMSTGAAHTFVLRDGNLHAWGFNAFGQLGNGTTTSTNLPVSTYILIGGVTAVSAGGNHSLAIKGEALFAWGDNRNGQLGDGTTVAKNVPTGINGFPGGVTAVSGGFLHSLVIQYGAVLACGSNLYGQLGDGTVNQRTTFATVTGLISSVTAVSAGGYHNLAVRNGAVLAWGDNYYGELGDGTNTNRNVPVALSLNSGVTSVAAGHNHSLAVQNGKVYAWGNAPLGDGTNNNSTTPIQIDPVHLHDIVAVAAGVNTSYALSSDGSLWVWGVNDRGQLGLSPTATPYLIPQHRTPPSGFVFTSVSVNAEGFHGAAILSPVGYTAPAFVNGEAPLGNDVYFLGFSDTFFGYYSYLPDPHYIYHFDMGYEYLIEANDGKAGVFLCDFQSGGFFYTSPVFPFPYLYDFTLNTVLYYYPNPDSPGNYNTNGIRYFYRFDTGQIISK